MVLPFSVSADSHNEPQVGIEPTASSLQEKRSTDELQGHSSVAFGTLVSRPESVCHGVMIRAQNSEVVKTAILCISVNMVNLYKRLSVNRMSFIPSTDRTGEIVLLKNVSANSLFQLHGYSTVSRGTG